MKDFPIPVRAIGPGSQPDDDAELDFLEMPRGMSTFQMPRVPEKVDPLALAESRDVLARFLAELEGWDPEREPQGPRTEMTGITPAALAITNEVLGEGEVSIQIGGERRFRIQESVFTGLWRCCEVDAGGRLARDWLEAAAVPQIAIDAARDASAVGVAEVEWPPGAMNSPALVAEIGSQVEGRAPGARAHVINMTLFPMTPDDHAVLERALPVGPVAMISRGFGNCRVTSTLTRDVWRVQYFNSMNTLILNTLEVVDMPEVAVASAEDLADSRTRMAELVEWMSESCAEQAQPLSANQG
ncbi:MAG TPA: hydrogenase expression/formation protein [Caldimonas sp.]|jgi:hydrogenase-1 operon protein HyaF